MARTFPLVANIGGYRALRATFQRIVLLALGAPAVLQACSGDGANVGGADGGADASYGDAPSADAGADANGAEASVDGTADGGAADTGDVDGGDSGPEFPTCSEAGVSAPYLPDDAGDAAGACYFYIDYSCPTLAPMGNDCHLAAADCIAACAALDAGIFECLYLPTSCAHGTPAYEAGSPVTLACSLCPGGRRPVGLVSRRPRRAGSALGSFFARAAHLEAASVIAFERLAADLREHGAPPRLVESAGRAARDEALHARVMGRLARRHGADPATPEVAARRRRSIERIARENEVEGCVREAFGALVATWQAERAGDPEVRRAMRRIAADETRHAALSLAVSRWANGRLDARARARIAGARRAEIDRLARESRGELPRELVVNAGLPPAIVTKALVAGLVEALWC